MAELSEARWVGGAVKKTCILKTDMSAKAFRPPPQALMDIIRKI